MNTCTIPPLRQSTVERMSCPEMFDFVSIQGHNPPASMNSDRGTDIHAVMAAYVDHCVQKRVPADWAAFDRLASKSGPEAGVILDGIRMNMQVDWNRVYATELKLSLTEDLQKPAEGDDIGHEGTLDVLLMLSDTAAKIEDYKSHPRPFEPRTYQGVLYPFMVFATFPHIEEVTFELIFVRYRNCRRSITWRRSDMPEMALVIQRARSRQIAMHEGDVDIIALPGSHCAYCPKATNFTCSIAEMNEQINLSVQDRLRMMVWWGEVAKRNADVLKSIVDRDGKPVSYTDGRGRKHSYGVFDTQKTTYPLDDTTLGVMDGWARQTGDDWRTWGLAISSTKLKARLKTKKRAALSEQFDDSLIEAVSQPKFRVKSEDPEAEDRSGWTGDEAESQEGMEW